MRSILVVGLREKDAGKTTLALALISHLKDAGFKVCGFKPKAGNNFWYDYDVVCEALSQGRLYGKDAKLLTQASGVSLPEEVVNPIHRLWIDESLQAGPNGLPGFLADRVTLPETGRGFFLTLNMPMLRRYADCSGLLATLRNSARLVAEVQSLKELNRAVSEFYSQAVRAAYGQVSRYEVLVVESYSDVAMPWEGLENLEAIFGVEPWRLCLYEPERYLTAVRMISQVRQDIEVTANQVCRLVKPLAEVRLKPSTEAIEALKAQVKPLLKDLNLA